MHSSKSEFIYLCVNLLADVLYGLVNPEVRAAME
jgi:ABC-type dipeptide/oligopeptide/nickel transport system permease component